MSIWTCKLKFDSRLQGEHDRDYSELVHSLTMGGAKDFEEGQDPPPREEAINFMNQSALLHLCSLAICPLLHEFAVALRKEEFAKLMEDKRPEQAYSFTWLEDDPSFWRLFRKTSRKWPELMKDFNSKIKKQEDIGFSAFFDKLDREGPKPVSRSDRAVFLGQHSPKLCYMLNIFDAEGIDVLGFSINLISGRQSRHENARALHCSKTFNNPTSDCQVLLTTFGCGSSGLNLHYACSRAIVLESPPNYSMLLHVIGRLHRLGQKEKQKVWILFADHTIDRYLECINANKATPQFASQLDPNLVKAHVAEMLKSNKSLKKREATRLVTKSLADGAMMKQFGQVRSRMEMRNPKILDRNGDGYLVRGWSGGSTSISAQQTGSSSSRSLTDAPSSGMSGQAQHSLKRPAEDNLQESSESEGKSRRKRL
ncbi:hypothetical protein BDV19DRAFT_385629 [Aspergillus venezuelensis]